MNDNNKWSEFLLVKIYEMGQLSYSPEKMALMLGLNEELTRKLKIDFDNIRSPLRVLYDQAQAACDFERDQRLLELSLSTGDPIYSRELQSRQVRYQDLAKERNFLIELKSQV